MAKIVPRETNNTVVVKTKADAGRTSSAYKWWKAKSKKELAAQLLETVSFLKEQQQFRYRQAAIYGRLYGNMPIFNFAGSNLNKMNSTNNLPVDRPTMNVIQSCVDTLVSRISQARPRPVFLTDNGDYKQRNLAKQMNTFINGELYQTKAYDMVPLVLRDASALGTGCIKIYENTEKKVALERVLLTELLVDPNDALYGEPRQLFQLKLIDKSVLQEIFPEYRSDIAMAEQAFPDGGGDSQKTISDQIIVAEAWHLPSGEGAGDGRHVIVCSSGVIFDEDYTKDKFPFVFLHYSPRILGFWGQGLSEQLMGTQVEINKLLMTISNAINLVGVPRVFVEDGSKVVKAHLNNQIGAIVTYRGTKPSYEVAPCVPQELYAQLERLVQYAYQQSGISALAATSQKPAGLNSGEAIRNYDDLQSDRFAALNKRYNDVFMQLSYQIVSLASEIADRDGSYSTVYPNKDGTREIDLPETGMLKEPVIQIFDSSSLPRDPAGRLQKVTEMMQSGLISPQEGRRLLDYPDIEQVDKLENAGEERILQILDDIVESGKEGFVDAWIDIQLATKLTTQYINLYTPAKLEESKAQKLRDFYTRIQSAIAIMTAPPPMAPGAPALGSPVPVVPGAGGPPNPPQAVPMAPPHSELLPNIPQPS